MRKPAENRVKKGEIRRQTMRWPRAAPIKKGGKGKQKVHGHTNRHTKIEKHDEICYNIQNNAKETHCACSAVKTAPHAAGWRQRWK